MSRASSNTKYSFTCLITLWRCVTSVVNSGRGITINPVVMLLSSILVSCCSRIHIWLGMRIVIWDSSFRSTTWWRPSNCASSISLCFLRWTVLLTFSPRFLLPLFTVAIILHCMRTGSGCFGGRSGHAGWSGVVERRDSWREGGGRGAFLIRERSCHF